MKKVIKKSIAKAQLGSIVKKIGKSAAKEVKLNKQYNPYRKATPVKDVAKGTGVVGLYGVGAGYMLNKEANDNKATANKAKVAANKAKVKANAEKVKANKLKTAGKYKFATGGSTFGMLSVKAGIDKNPNPTAADRIAGATKNKKKMDGAKKPLRKAQTGITVSNPKDPRYQAYKDSMTLYNYSKNLDDLYTKRRAVTSPDNFGQKGTDREFAATYAFADLDKNKYNWEGTGAKEAYARLKAKNAAPTPKETTYPSSYYDKLGPKGVTSQFPKPVKKVTYKPSSATPKANKAKVEANKAKVEANKAKVAANAAKYKKAGGNVKSKKK